MNKLRVSQRRAAGRRERGIGLVELMVSITIGLVILSGVLQLYASSMATQRSQEGFSRVQENMRYAFSRLESDISQAGFTGCFPFTNDRITVTLEDNVGAGLLYDFSAFISGTNDNGPMNSDTLIIRYASGRGAIPLESPMTSTTSDIELDDTDPDYAALEQYDIVMVSDCSRAAVFMITNDPTASGGTIQHLAGPQDPDGQKNVTTELENQFGADDIDGGSRAFIYSGSSGAHAYTIGTSAAGNAAGGACVAATPEFCALFRDNVELVEGVENMQLEFGAQNAAGNLRFTNAANVADWTAVDRVRITLTFNSVQRAISNDGSDLVDRTLSKIVMIRNQLPAI